MQQRGTSSGAKPQSKDLKNLASQGTRFQDGAILMKQENIDIANAIGGQGPFGYGSKSGVYEK